MLAGRGGGDLTSSGEHRLPDPTLTAPHVSNRILGGFLLSLEDELGEAAVQAILAEAGLPRSYFQQIDGWVSHAFTVALAEAVAHHVHGLGELPPHDHALWQLWRQAGRDAMSPERFGALFLLVRALGSPRQVY